MQNATINTLKAIRANVELRGKIVTLVPMMLDHIDQLIVLANDRRIWEFYAYDGTDISKMRSVLSSALEEKAAGTQFPFVIFDRASGKMIGSTRFMEIVSRHRKMEIGSTWLHPDYWASAVNPDCKLLLLTCAFEELGALRVQLKTDERNVRSRRAIEKIGGVFEGVLRNDMLRDDGTKRNSAYYSLIDSEWPEKKELLTKFLTDRAAASGE